MLNAELKSRIDPEVKEFVRRRGITRCPPGPVVRMSWGRLRKARGFGEQSEADLLAYLAEGAVSLSIAERCWVDKLRREAAGPPTPRRGGLRRGKE